MENLHQIKENLREILGVEAARRCSDFQIQALLDSFESRPDCVEVVLQSLCEQSFEGAFGEEIVTDEGFVFLGDQDLERTYGGIISISFPAPEQTPACLGPAGCPT